jgi:hypothetical protein
MPLRSLLTGSAAALAMMAASAVSAAPVDGTAAVSVIGISSPSASIGVGSVFTNTINSIISGATDDLVTILGDTFTTDPITASVGSVVSFTAAFGSFSGTISIATSTGPTTARVVDIYALGTFTPAGDLAAFSAGPMSLTASFTQSGVGGAISGSYSLASPPAPPPGEVSEPATLALLGAGLIGLAMVRRRKTV